MRRGLLRQAANIDFLTDLVAYYKFEGNANDYTGVNNGTPTGLTYTAGQVGDCAVFNGTTQSINIDDNDSLSFTDGVNDVPFTFVFGMYLGTATGGVEYVINKRGNAINYEWDIIRTSTLLTLSLFSEGGANRIFIDVDITSLSLNTWYHVVFTYDGSAIQTGLNCKINNVDASVTKSVTTYVRTFNTIATLRISSRAWAGAALRFSGRLDDFAIYKNRKFSNAEIAAAYNKFNSGQPLLI